MQFIIKQIIHISASFRNILGRRISVHIHAPRNKTNGSIGFISYSLILECNVP